MGKADEERLAIGVQKCSCLYDKAVRKTVYVIKTVLLSFMEDLTHPKSSACVFILQFVKHY